MNNESLIKCDRIILKIVGVIKILMAIFIMAMGILCATVLKDNPEVNKIIAEANIPEVANMSVYTLLLVVGVVLGIIYLIVGILCFKATKKEARGIRIALVVYGVIAIILSTLRNSGFSLQIFLAELPDMLLILVPPSLNKYFKSE